MKSKLNILIPFIILVFAFTVQLGISASPIAVVIKVKGTVYVLKDGNKAKADGPRIRITQIRSEIGYDVRQRRVLAGMGITRMGRSVVLEDTPSTRGMAAKIPHLVRVEEIES